MGVTEKITKLNMELATVNDRVLNFSKTATRLEDQLKKMESKYEEQLKLEERANELNKKFAERKLEQDKVRKYLKVFYTCYFGADALIISQSHPHFNFLLICYTALGTNRTTESTHRSERNSKEPSKKTG